MTSQEIIPFNISIPQSDLDDLKDRLSRTRWPDKEPVSDWSQGVPLVTIKTLCAYWHDHYDWRRCEALLNSYPQFLTTIDGIDVHFLHVRSSAPDALPLLMTHGWPGSVLEFRKVIEPLIDPTSHGGTASDAFHLVMPSLPGYGFSSKPQAGCGLARNASAWAELMRRLGYDGYVAQGGDWGANVSAMLAHQAPRGLLGVHLNSAFFDVRMEIGDKEPTAEEARALRCQERWDTSENGYWKQHATRPQTVGYGLADSPAGQAAWIYEKIWMWSQHEGDVETLLSKDEILDNIMMYWLTNSGASSARKYWDDRDVDTTAWKTDVPIGISMFPGDNTWIPRAWGERYYRNIIHWRGNIEKGGHFAAWEQPGLFVREVRECFKHVR